MWLVSPSLIKLGVMATRADVWPSATPCVLRSASENAPTFAPVRFVYKYLHDAITCELEFLARGLEEVDDEKPDAGGALKVLLERYQFLQQIYTYHSTVEDEVRAVFEFVGGVE